MDCDQIIFSGHAVERMYERGIARNDILRVLRRGEMIAEYPDDKPFPSRLMLGLADRRPVHILVAVESERRACYIVTVYEPDPDVWGADFKRRTS